MVQSFWEKFDSYNPAIPPLGIYQRAGVTYIPIKTCAQMFITALFIIAKNWGKNPNVRQMWTDKHNTVSRLHYNNYKEE